MDLAVRNGDRKLIDKAVEITLRTLDFGWDPEYEGIYYFVDIKDYPVKQLEWLLPRTAGTDAVLEDISDW